MTFDLATHPSRSLHRRTSAGLGLLALLLLCTPPPTAAVVCPFSDFMPNGPQPVGFAEAWIERAPGAAPIHLQWWFPAQPVDADQVAHLAVRDYELSRLRDYRSPEPLATAIARRELQVQADAARARGASAVRYLHVGAAAMLAIRDATPRPGPWPLVWVGGDSSFADQLASHGMVTVASPRAFGAEANIESELADALLAMQESEKRYPIDRRRMGVLGLNGQVPLAARLAGALPEVDALAVLGAWPSPRQGGYWFDPGEIHQPTLVLRGAGADRTPTAHPLGSPLAGSEWMILNDIEDAMLEFGMHNHCAPKYTPMARPLHSMVLLQTQYALRHRLAEFFTARFGLDFEPATMRLTPLAESRKQTNDIVQQTLPALSPAPPSRAEIVQSLRHDGGAALLAGLTGQRLALLPARWWHSALQLAESEHAAAVDGLLLALESVQRNSGLAATWRAAQAAAAKAGNAHRLRKRALARVDRDPRLSPPMQAELRERLSR